MLLVLSYTSTFWAHIDSACMAARPLHSASYLCCHRTKALAALHMNRFRMRSSCTRQVTVAVTRQVTHLSVRACCSSGRNRGRGCGSNCRNQISAWSCCCWRYCCSCIHLHSTSSCGDGSSRRGGRGRGWRQGTAGRGEVRGDECEMRAMLAGRRGVHACQSGTSMRLRGRMENRQPERREGRQAGKQMRGRQTDRKAGKLADAGRT